MAPAGKVNCGGGIVIVSVPAISVCKPVTSLIAYFPVSGRFAVKLICELLMGNWITAFVCLPFPAATRYTAVLAVSGIKY